MPHSRSDRHVAVTPVGLVKFVVPPDASAPAMN